MPSLKKKKKNLFSPSWRIYCVLLCKDFGDVYAFAMSTVQDGEA